jgi:tetratricopeptide (TPR) repeat protein
MKLGNNICWAALLGAGLLIGQPDCKAELGIAPQKKEQKDRKQIKLTEQQQLEFDYAFAEAEKTRILGDIKKAISWYATCLKIDPNSAVVRYELANIYMAQENFNSALELARNAVALQPQNLWYQIQLAKIYQKKGMIDHACGVYDQLIEYFPDRNDFYYFQAALYASIEKREEAIEVYNRLEKKIGITEAVSLEKEGLYIAMGKRKLAYNELQKLIREFPRKAELYGLLADLYLEDGQDDKAFKLYEKILKLDPQNGLVHFYLSQYYYKKGDMDLFYEEIQIAFKNSGVEVDQKIQYLISSLMQSGKATLTDDQIKSLLDILVEMHDQNARVHALYADFLRKSKDNEGARKHLWKVLEQEKGNYVVWEELLLIENELLDFEKMYIESNEALKYFPGQPLLYMFNGVAALQLKKYKEAAHSLKAGIDYIGDNIPMRVQFLSYLGEAYFQMGDSEKAYEAFEEVLLFDPDNVMVLNNYSYYLSLHGENLKKAEEMSSRCVEMEGTNSTYLDTHAWVLYQRGRFSEAKRIMERALSNGGRESAVIVEHYGDILFQLGEKDKALEEWKKAEGMGSDSQSLAEKVKTGTIPEVDKKNDK